MTGLRVGSAHWLGSSLNSRASALCVHIPRTSIFQVSYCQNQRYEPNWSRLISCSSKTMACASFNEKWLQMLFVLHLSKNARHFCCEVTGPEFLYNPNQMRLEGFMSIFNIRHGLCQLDPQKVMAMSNPSVTYLPHACG